jgi:tetratricopeptide (TPR) repeat protein
MSKTTAYYNTDSIAEIQNLKTQKLEIQKLALDKSKTELETAQWALKKEKTITISIGIGIIILLVIITVLVISKWKMLIGYFSKFKLKKISLFNSVQIEAQTITEEKEIVEINATVELPTIVEEETTVKEISFVDLHTYYKGGKFEEGDKKLEELNSKETDPKEIAINKIVSLRLKYEYGDTNAIKELEKYILIEEKKEYKAYALYSIGLCYTMQNSFDVAIKYLEQCLSLLIGLQESLQLSVIKRISECKEKLQSKDEKVAYLIREAYEPSNEFIRFEIIEYIILNTDDAFLKVILQHLVLKNKGNDTTLLFNTAYNYAELDEHKLAVTYYKQLLRINNDEGALNNLAVSYSSMKLKAIANSYFKKALDAGNSLAASNYANNLINAGFIDEASDKLSKNENFKDIHENYLTSKTTLKNAIEARDKEAKSTEEHSLKLKLFIDKINDKIGEIYNQELYLHSMIVETESGISISVEKTDKHILTWQIEEVYHKITLHGLLSYGRLSYISYKQFSTSGTKYSEEEYNGLYRIEDDKMICIIHNKDIMMEIKIKLTNI